MTIALAVLAAGITGVVMLSVDVGFPASRAVVAVPLAVIGIGLLIGSFTRRGRGLVLIAIPLILVGFVMSWAPRQHWRGVGELRAAPVSTSSVAPDYEQSFGNIELDLRQLDLAAAPAAPIGEPVRTRVTVQFGEALVLIPPDADVRVHCHAAIGEVDCLGDRGARYGATGDDGPTADAVVNNLGDDRVAGGRPLEIDVNVGTGSVEVRRG